DRLGPDVAAATAIAAPRAAIFDELLAPERDAAVPAFAGFDIDLGNIEELHAAFLVCLLPRAARARAVKLSRMMGRCGACAPTVSKPAFSKLEAEPVYMFGRLTFSPSVFIG